MKQSTGHPHGAIPMTGHSRPITGSDSMTGWASRPLGASASEYLAAIRSRMPVSLIATPRVALKSQRKDRWREVDGDPDLAGFDQVPITDGAGGHFVAVFVRGTGLVDLREDMFMASDAALISFLESADQQRFRFLLEGRQISGMVTLSDVQKLPVYSVLFSLLIAVEMLLMDRIRKSCGTNDDEWLDHLDRRQRGIVEKHWKVAVKSNIAIDRLSCASFGQEIQAAAGLGLFRGHDERHEALKKLEALRHQICHAVEFAPTPDQALRIPRHVRDAEATAVWLLGYVQGASA